MGAYSAYQNDIADWNKVPEKLGSERVVFLSGAFIFDMKNFWRAAAETGFIIFLFYSNLLMGEFTHSGAGQGKGLAWAVADIFTAANFAIAVIAALIGYLLIELVRSKL